MLGLHVGHVHLPGYPEALYLGNIRHLETTVQLAHLVVIFHPDRYQTVLTYQGRFPGVNITLVLRQGFQFPALLSVDGFFAQNSAIASGAEAAIIPEDRTDADQLETFIGRGFRKTKNSSIVIVTESPGNKNGGAMHYADRVKREYPGYDVRVSILGHLQRGGAPSANDRILASRLGEAAIQALMEDQHNIMVGIHNNEIVYVPFDQAIKNDKPIDKNLIRVLNELSI